ncbi:tri14-like protein [Beauveria brongniartii RCEF 3172]|uniref:Tri14-like protein n=1 Tax=Beauveria brongniartii RCEF 3172 TaxID=1081107 RepID=A0A166VTQ9_9HYPO|nr:tri14-like protein [Beauveria brongniartii RCEF 3172]
MVSSSVLPALIPAVAASPLTCAAPKLTTCEAPRGNFTVNAAGLYPENADFDDSRCVTYISNLYKGTVSVYDATANRVSKIITLDGISNVPAFHVGGVQRDRLHDKLTISANAAAAFDTSGDDVSGTNLIVQYNLAEDRVEWAQNLTAVSNGVYGGFQDIEHDAAGNSFVVGSFPSSIVKITPDGKTATPWFGPSGTNTTLYGFAGIAAFNDARSALVPDGESGQVVRFDLTAEAGKPVIVTLGSTEPIGGDLDGGYLPPLYKDTVFLISDNVLGTIVLKSDDKWETAKNVGVVPNALGSTGGFHVATVQIVDRVYAVTEWFRDNAPGASLNRTEFPFIDITDDINQLLI